MAKYDIIVKNGSVFDGIGVESRKIDIAIIGDKIVDLGDFSKIDAKTVIDATDKYVCPGFIDITNHSDTHWTLFTHPSQESLIRQGITTIIGGSCGFSLAPVVGGKGIRKNDVAKININWQTVGEFFKMLEKNKLALNFGTLVGLNTLQYDVMGESVESPDKEKLDQIKFLLNQALKDGALGLSTNLGALQAGSFGDSDLVELLKVVSKNKGISKHHLEDEGKNVLPAISRIINITRKINSMFLKLPVHISHFKILGRSSWTFFNTAIEIMRTARKEEIELTCDVFPYDKTGDNLFALLPSWLRKMSTEDIREIVTSSENKYRQEVIAHLKSLTLHYDRIIIASSLTKGSWVGKTIAEASEASGVPPEELILNLLSISNLNVSIFNKVISDDHIRNLIQEDYCVLSSDGVGYSIEGSQSPLSSLDLPHPKSFGSFPRALKLFAKEEKIIGWGGLINRATSLPASILGIKDRGVIARKKKADVIIFDPNYISDYSTYENPFAFSKGVEVVVVNGHIVFFDNKLINQTAGQILRK